MLNYNLFKTGLLSCVLLAFFACKQSEPSYLSTLQRAHDTYLQQFKQSADALQKQSAQVKATLNATADSTTRQKIEYFDKKLVVYQERSTTQLDKFQQIVKKFESGTIPQAEMATYETTYVAEFKAYEDAFSQLKTYLDSFPAQGGKANK